MESGLSLAHIDKRFGETRAVRDASARFVRGEIHAVLGENGAGKSTLLRIAAGVLSPNAGSVAVDGAPLALHDAAHAIRRGIGMVEQHFSLIGVFDAIENVALGVEPVRRFALDRRAVRTKLERVLRELDAPLPLDVPVATFGVGDRQRLEIARILYRDAHYVILDEPTAVLAAPEATTLYHMLRRLAQAGHGVVVVTHKLDEVIEHADVVTVMRRGEVVATRRVARNESSARELAELVMGGAVPDPPARTHVPFGDVVLQLTSVRLGMLKDASFSVRAGEIVGIAGVEGNGQRELVRVLAGQKPEAGEVRMPPMAVVHEDRHAEGLVLDASLRDNAVLGEFARFSRFGILDAPAIDRAAVMCLDRAGVLANPDRLARTLSGGNQQKIVVERALGKTERGARCLVLAHPTRGVDIAASRAIHASILAARARGVAVVVISSDLAELRALADRILVLVRGKIARAFAPSASDVEIGHAMLGAAHEHVA